MRPLTIALRRLRQSPGFGVFVVATLALGIGAATAAYSALYAIALRPPGFDPRGLTLVDRSNSISRNVPTGVSWRDFERLRDQARSFRSVAAWTTVPNLSLASQSASAFVQIEAVTGNYFGMLGVRPLLGRLIQPADDAPNASLVMVLSESTWRSQFGGDPAVVGSIASLVRRRVEIVGVAPAGFRGVSTLFVSQYAGWVSLSFVPTIRDKTPLLVAGRLREGGTTMSAGAELATLAGAFDRADPLPALSRAQANPRGWSALAYNDTMTASLASEAGRILLALPALVLLVACTNLTNLVLSRGTARRQAFAIRRALGGSHWRLVREELGEVVLLACAGGALAVLVTQALLTWTVTTLDEPLSALAPMIAIQWRMQPIVFAAAGGAALLAMLVGGLVPAWHLTRPRIGRGLTTDALGAMPRWRGRSNLIALQVGVSVALFLLTAIAVRFTSRPPVNSAVQLQSLGAGLDHLAVATVPLTAQQLDPLRARDLLAAIASDLAAKPGVARIALANTLPGLYFAGEPVRAYLRPAEEALVTIGPEAARSPTVPLVVASPEIFAALQLSAASGRVFTADDAAGADEVMVLDHTAAARLFGQTAAIGRRVRFARTDAPDRVRDAAVIGVLASSPLDAGARAAADPRTGDRGVAYVPFAQHDVATMMIVARSRSDDARPILPQITAAIRRADPEIAVSNLGRADVMAAGPLVFLKYITTVTAGLALLALVLAMGGLYGVLSQVVSERTREMGVRIALGAEPGHLARLVLRDGFRPVTEGLFVGLASAWTVKQLMQPSFTARLSSIDPVLVAMAAAPLVAAASIAAYLPARRAARVDPNVALRDL